MTWGADVTLYNTAIDALTKYIVGREAVTPFETVKSLKNTAQVALDALATQTSATYKMPKNHPGG